MEFVKKNMTLMVVLAATLIGSAFLIIMDVKKRGAVVDANALISGNKAKIEDLNKKSPAPLLANLDMIKKDTSIMREKTSELQRLFGKPLRIPLQKFAEAVDLSESDLLVKFRDFCMANPKLVDKYALLDSFVKSFPDDKGPAAVSAFRKSVQEHMLEPVADSNCRDMLLQAFGIPRTMNTTICKDYIIKMQEFFVANYKPLVTNENVAKMTFDYASRVPSPEEVSAIIRHLQMFEDLFLRLREADIVQINSLSRKNQLLLGEEVSRDYIKFTYTASIVGEMQKIKAFVNLLQESYKDNRIYIVKDIAMQDVADDVLRLADKSSIVSPRITSSVKRAASPDSKDKDVEVPPEQREGYGKPVVGENKLVQADIEFDYYIYVGDELKR